MTKRSSVDTQDAALIVRSVMTYLMYQTPEFQEQAALLVQTAFRAR